MITKTWPKCLIVFLVMSVVFGGYLTFIGGCDKPAYAGHCRVQTITSPVYTYQAVSTYAEPVYLQQVMPNYYYSVGTDLQLDAIAERLAERIEAKIIARQEARVPRTILAQSCAKCHSPGSKQVGELRAPVFFDDAGVLIATAEQRASMKTAARLGAMPPPPAEELSDDDYLQLKSEIDRSAIAEPLPRTAPPPVPVEAGRAQPPLPPTPENGR
jgi:hypothetical protein